MCYPHTCAGLRSEVTRFFKYTLALMLMNFTVGSLALAVGAAVGQFSIANPIYVMILVIAMVKHITLFIMITNACLLCICIGVQWIFDQANGYCCLAQMDPIFQYLQILY